MAHTVKPEWPTKTGVIRALPNAQPFSYASTIVVGIEILKN